MPLIRIEYDDAVVQESDARSLSVAVRDIVSTETDIEDVFAYANSARIKIKVAPIEIFVEMSAHKIKDPDILLIGLKTRLSDWKKQSQFPHQMNLTVIPMPWKIAIGV
jgi:hypothetical protein